MNKHIKTVFEKPMSRKEFLGYIAAAVLAVVGVTGMIKALLHHGGNGGHLTSGAADSYGSTPYGGLGH